MGGRRPAKLTRGAPICHFVRLCGFQKPPNPSENIDFQRVGRSWAGINKELGLPRSCGPEVIVVDIVREPVVVVVVVFGLQVAMEVEARARRPAARDLTRGRNAGETKAVKRTGLQSRFPRSHRCGRNLSDASRIKPASSGAASRPEGRER